MSLFRKIGAMMRRRSHARDIEQSLDRYRRFSGRSAGVKQAYADKGTFRTQVERLFALGNASETAALKTIAESTVGSTLTNRYYRAADYLSDVIDDLEQTTFFTGEPLGEPGLEEDMESFERELKLKAVSEAWLVPLKVASIESSVMAHIEIVGRGLPYAALERFERSVAQLFAISEQSERTLVEQRVRGFLEAWRGSDALRAAFPAPADAVSSAVASFRGDEVPEAAAALRRRRHDQPIRLSTVVPEERQHYLRATFARWESDG